MNDQLLPRALILLLTFLFASNLIFGTREQPSCGGKGWWPTVAVALIFVAGFLLAFKVHWYPADDATGTP